MIGGEWNDLTQALAHRSGAPGRAARGAALDVAETADGTSFGAAVAILRELAKGLDDEDPRSAAGLLQERISTRPDAAALRAGLLELGARLLLHRLTRDDL